MDSDDDLLNASNTATPPAKSTKMPIKPRAKPIKKKLQEEELNVMKGLASSFAKESKKEKNEGGECESYGKFLAESLKKMNESTRHMVQYHINNILFQAQMGMLTPGQLNLTVPSLQEQYPPQQNRYLPQQQQYMPCGMSKNQGV